MQGFCGPDALAVTKAAVSRHFTSTKENHLEASSFIAREGLLLPLH